MSTCPTYGTMDQCVCPPTFMHLPGHICLEETPLTPIEEDGESMFDSEENSIEEDSVLGIPCDLLPDHFQRQFLDQDLILFRRAPTTTSAANGREDSWRDFDAHLRTRVMIFLNLFASSNLLALLQALWALGCYTHQLSAQVWYILTTIFLLIRTAAVFSTLTILLHHRVDGLHCIGNTILDIFNFWNTIIWDVIHNALRPKLRQLIVDYSPLSGVEGQKSLNSGWLILYLVRYPDLVTSRWVPIRSIVNCIYHLWQDWRRYKVSSEPFESLERLGAIKSGVPVVEYSIEWLEYYAIKDLISGRGGFRFLQKHLLTTTINVTTPPVVSSYDELIQFRQHVSDAIIVVIDFENVDHTQIPAVLPNLSEVGFASFDMRSLRGEIENSDIHDLIEEMKVRHVLVDEWAWVTAKTCPAFWHRHVKAHTAQPYDCEFALSESAATPSQAMQLLGDYLVDLHQKDSEGNQLDEPREVIVLFFAAHLEKTTFEEAALHHVYNNSSFTFWDLQRWRLVWNRWRRAASCGDFLRSLGVQDVILHNATNDAFLELFGFLRLLQATAEDLESWRHGGLLTTDFDLEWTTRNGYYLRQNQALGRKAVNNYYRQRQILKNKDNEKNKENQTNKHHQNNKENKRYRTYKKEGSTSTPSPEPKQTVTVIGRSWAHTDNTSWRR
ncbi:hypothetical protein V8F33_009843 [Rhypophila sp. PSN 637]